MKKSPEKVGIALLILLILRQYLYFILFCFTVQNMSQNQKQSKHSNEEKGATGNNIGMKASKLDAVFEHSGLGTGAVARDTISFIQGRLSDNKRKTQEGKQFQQNALLSKAALLAKPEINKSSQEQPFLSNHGAQVFRKQQEKKWNTGTVDTVNLFSRREQASDDKTSLLELQKAVNQQRKLKTKKTQAVHVQHQDEDTAAYARTIRAMREKERQEALELERLMSDEDFAGAIAEAQGSGGEGLDSDIDEEEEFHQEMLLIEQQRRDEANRQRKTLQEVSMMEKQKQELELQKWKDTGFEDEIARVYQNPTERRKAAAAQKASKKQAQGLKPQITTGPDYKNIGNQSQMQKRIAEQIQQESQASTLQNHLTLESTLKQKKDRTNAAHTNESLFAKSGQTQRNTGTSGQYITLDGSIRYDKPHMATSRKYEYQANQHTALAGALDASYTTLAENRKAANYQRQLVEQTKNKTYSQSRFFLLKQAQSSSLQHAHLASQTDGYVAGKNGGVSLYRAGQSTIQFVQQEIGESSYSSGRRRNLKSQNLSPFGQMTQQNAQSRIPDVKEWLESLQMGERVLAITTVDAKITKNIKAMHLKLKRAGADETGKFRMVSSVPAAITSLQITNLKEKTSVEQKERRSVPMMHLCNTQAYKSTAEVTLAEQELLNFVRFTDTHEMHDTLTVTEDLLQEPQKFYKLAEKIVGSNYLKQPHEIRWLEEEETPQYEFESCAPLWLDMHQPNSLASWILYYIERALFIQYQFNVKVEFQNCKDQSKQPIFIHTDGKNIVLKDEIKPFWRTFCEEAHDAKKDKAEVQELLALVRQQALTEFGVQPASTPADGEKTIDTFNGGLTIHSDQEASKGHLVAKIEDFLTTIEKSVQNFKVDQTKTDATLVQLNLKETCMNTLKESSSLVNPGDSKQIAKDFMEAVQKRAGNSASKQGFELQSSSQLEQAQHIVMRMERILIDAFRNMVTSKLKSQFTTANRRLQKKKIKKLKQKEQAQERERERQLEEERQRQSEAKKKEPESIVVNNSNAIELLIGSSQVPKLAVKEPESKPVTDILKGILKQVQSEGISNTAKVDKEPAKAPGSKAAKKRKKGKKSAEPGVDQDRAVVEEEDEFSIKRPGTNEQVNNRQQVPSLQVEKAEKDLTDISITNLPLKPSTPKEHQQQKNQPQAAGSMLSLTNKIDPQNYFQVFGHKYAASLESQGGSQVSSDISGAAQLNKGLESSITGSRGGTIKTLSTNEESKKTKQDQRASVQKAAEQAMSNQEVLNLLKQSSNNSQGNSQINKRTWQRKVTGIGEMINELLSEASSTQNMYTNHDNLDQASRQNLAVIDVLVKEDHLHAKLDDSASSQGHSSGLQIPSPKDSSHSSVKDNNRIVKLTKTQNRKVIPRQLPQASDSSSSSDGDSDQDLLPDIYTNIRPEDNDSSDYGMEAGQGEDESIDDDSSVALSKNQNSQFNHSPPQVQKTRNRRHDQKSKFRSTNSTKKSIKSANAKIVEPIDKNKRQIVMNKKTSINFYPRRGHEEVEEQEEQAQLVFESQTIVNRWIKLKANPPLTCVYISMSRELNSESKANNKPAKKSKAQRKAEWQTKYGEKKEDHSEAVQPKQIEIIKPSEPSAKEVRAAAAQQSQPSKVTSSAAHTKHADTKTSQTVIESKMEKKKSKKASNIVGAGASQSGAPSTKISNPVSSASASAEAMNQFMKKMHGSASHGQEGDKMEKKAPVAALDSSPLPAGKQMATVASAVKENQSKDKDLSKGESSSKEKPGKPQTEYQKKKELQIPPKQYAKKHQGQRQTEPAERLSMMEEAKILKDGYHYQVKNKDGQKSQVENKEKSSKQENEPKTKKEEQKTSTQMIEKDKEEQIISKSAPLKSELSKTEKSGLSIASKEYQVTQKTKKLDASGIGMQQTISSLSEAIEGQTADQNAESQMVAAEPKKKSKKKPRSNKSRKKPHNQSLQQMQNNLKFDPMTGQPILMDFVMAQQTQGGFDGDQAALSKLQNNTFLPGQTGASFGFNQQVQDFIFQLNEQVMAQQQAQLQEMQLRQQQEADTQMQEECEPCEETNPARYEQFFEQLEEEMKNKVKEIDQLKDSVRKERQGFISIVETIVKDTFSNRYGNGFVGIKTFGSMATELAIETSDVDLVVTGISAFQPNYNYGREYSGKNQLLRMMQKLYDNLCFLKDKGQIYKIKFIDSANVPIIKLVVDLQMINKSQIEKAIERINKEREEENEDGQNQQAEAKTQNIDFSELGLEAKQIEPTMRYLKVDISIDEQSQQYLKYDNQMYGSSVPRNHSGIDTIYHIQDLVKKRKDLRPIVMIMKKIFDETFLSMPYYGGISSYSLVLMVSAYLKAYDADKEASISRNLSCFFHFYGSQFKPHMYYLNGDDIVFCEDPARRPFQDPFIVLDPLDNSNNISHSTFRIKDIQRALVTAFKIINQSCEQFQRLSAADLLSPETQHCQPKQVLARLMSEIKAEYFLQNQYHDDD